MEQVDPTAWRDVLGVGGGWFVAILVVFLVVWSFIKGWITTGKALDREIERSKSLVDTNENLMQTVNTYASSVRQMIEVNRPAVKALSALQELPPADAKEPDAV